ncbi:MAG: hypothetical protein GQF41_2001 [Candidatus Rifleibacterium amylolyticum]|nr:MAG: hypothetical protein GQF41_2001 [Candidatus Rifleibacterium amylolyticum]
MLLISKFLLLMFPLLFIGFGVQMFYKNWQALDWPEVPIVIGGSDAGSSYDEDSETGEKTWSIDVRLHFDGSYEGKPISGSFVRSSRFGSAEPTPDEIEKQRQATLVSYQRDGLTARVNPLDTSETLVEPSLVGATFMVLIGIGLLILFIRKHHKISEDDI